MPWSRPPYTSSRTTAAALAMHGGIGAGIVGDLQPALDDVHRAGAMRQHRQHLRLVHQFGLRHADGDLDPHGIRRAAPPHRRCSANCATAHRAARAPPPWCSRRRGCRCPCRSAAPCVSRPCPFPPMLKPTSAPHLAAPSRPRAPRRRTRHRAAAPPRPSARDASPDRCQAAARPSPARAPRASDAAAP